MESDVGEKDRQFVNALAQGLEILRAFEPAGGWMSARELSERTGLPKQTISRLTSTLRELNCLSFDPRRGLYALAPGVLSLGYSVMASADLGDRASPVLDALARSVNGVATLAALDVDEVVYLRVFASEATVSVHVCVGAKLPLAVTACGRAIVAGMGEEAREALFEKARAKRSREEVAAIEGAAAEALDEYQRLGFCSSIGLRSPEVNGVAAPVRCFDCGSVFAFGLTAPAYLQPAERWFETHGPRTAEAARRMSAPDTTPKGSSRRCDCVEQGD